MLVGSDTRFTCCCRTRVAGNRLRTGLEARLRGERHLHNGARTGRHVSRHLRLDVSWSVCRHETSQRLRLSPLSSQRLVHHLQWRLHHVQRRGRSAGKVDHLPAARYRKSKGVHAYKTRKTDLERVLSRLTLTYALDLQSHAHKWLTEQEHRRFMDVGDSELGKKTEPSKFTKMATWVFRGHKRSFAMSPLSSAAMIEL